MSVITISNQFGAGGPEVGREIAKRFDIDYLDKEILHKIALEVNLPDCKIAEFEPERHSKLKSFFSTVFDLDALQNKVRMMEEEFDEEERAEASHHIDGWIDSEIYRQMAVKIIGALGRRGNAVIVGRGGQCILHDNPRTLHVRCVADFEQRVQWTAARRNMNLDEARDFLRQIDSRSHDYLRFYFDRDPDEPGLYNIMLNTSRVSLDRCIDIVEQLARDIENQG